MNNGRRLLAIGILTFVALGMPKAAFGVAWPSVADDLSRPVGELGLIIAAHVVGYFVATATSGAVAARLGARRMLVLAAWLSVVALVGYAATPGSGALLVAAITLGLGGGYVDAGINTHVALRHGPRAMGLLHAGFGVGSTLGPLVMTVLLATGASWRWGFWLLAACQAAIAIVLMRTATPWASSPPREPSAARSRRLPAVAWWALLVFVLYAAIEIGTGQWAFTLLSEGRGQSEAVAGLAVTGFYAGITASRLLLAAVGNRYPAAAVSSGAAVAAVIGLMLVWWAPLSWVGPAALVGTGFALGPIFPLQTTLTPKRVGVESTSALVGYQIAAASLGAMLVPGLVGLLVDRVGVPVIAPVLAVTAAALVGADLMLRRAGRAAAEVAAVA